MSVYPYDPEGTLTTNVVKGTLKKETFPNKHNVLVPLEAPFFRKDFRLKKGEVTLIEGLDYYLVYYYKKAADSINKAVYGGILPISDFDNVEYQLRTLGGGHSVPFTELGRYLNNPELKDPRSTDWSELQRYPIDVEPIDPPANFDEAYEQDIVIRSIVKIKEALIASGEERDLLLAEVFDELEKTENYYNVNFLELHDKTEHKHGYDAEMVRALRKEATAVNALKAYGYTLAQMVDHAKEHGISMTRINELVDTNIGLIHGSLMNTLDAGIVLTTNGGTVTRRPRLELIKDNVTVDTGSGEVRFTGAEGVWMGAGVNAIVIPKVGGTLERPILNGYYMLIPTDVKRYLFAPASATLRATVANTETVQLSGDGTDGHPINGRINLPVASTTKEGLAYLVDEWGGTSLSAVVTQDLITKTIVNLEQGGYASNTLTINGKSFDANQRLDLTKADIGLNRVDDTIADEKPVSEALAAELAKKALDGHTHNPTDLENVVMASAEAAGLGKVGAGGFAKSADIEKFTTEAGEAVALMNNALPGWASSGAYYGDGSYLPAPVQGNYKGFGIDLKYRKQGIIVENNDVIILRSGTDGPEDTRAVYYWRCKISNNKLTNLTPMVVKYRPKFLDAYDGFEVTAILNTSEGVMFGEAMNKEQVVRYFVVLTKNTGDMEKHTDGVFFSGDFSPVNSQPVLHKDKVFFVKTYIDNSKYGTSVNQLSVTEIIEGAKIGAVVNLNPVLLSGKNFYNEDTAPSSGQDFMLVPDGRMSNRTDDGKWTSARNIRHGPAGNWYFVKQEGKIRVCNVNSVYFANPSSSRWDGEWRTSFVIDLESGLVTPDAFSFPVSIGVNGIEFNNGQLGRGGLSGFPANNTANSYMVGNNFLVIYHTNTHQIPRLVLVEPQYNGISPFDYANTLTTVSYKDLSNVIVDGAYGSPYVSSMRGNVKINKNTYLLRMAASTEEVIECPIDPNGNYGIPSVGGYGPEAGRKTIPWSVYGKYLNMSRVCLNGDEVLNGARFYGHSSQMPYNNNDDQIQISKAVWDQVIAQNKDFGTTEPKYNWGGANSLSHVLGVTLYDIGGENLAFFALANMYHEIDGDPNGTRKARIVYGVFKFETAGTSDNLTVSSMVGQTVGKALWLSGHIRSIGPHDVSQPILVKTSQKVYNFYSGFGIANSTVGGSGQWVLFFTWDYTQSRLVYSTVINGNISYGEFGYDYEPYRNLIVKTGYLYNNLYIGGDAFDPATHSNMGRCILLGAKTSEGWQVYFTQPYPFYTKGKVYTIPVAEFDLRTLFPANYRNRTFYIHARADDTKAWYTIDATKLPDTDTRLHIGFVRTDNERIVELVVDNVSRYGDVGALLRHTASRSAHSGTATNVIANSPYGELKNQGKMDSFTIPTFKDIFDTWYRFSHQTEQPNIYPAIASELNNWNYIAADDSVECTANTVSYVGFISNEFVGDYVFNTFITSTDADNDMISIIVAAFKKGDIDDKEHTLSITIDQTLNEEHAKPGSNIRLWDNNNQPGQTNIVTLNANRFSRTWNTSYAHVYVRKTGNVLKIAVENLAFPADMAATGGLTGLFNRKKLLTEDQIFADANYFKATVDLTIAAPKYARPARFGYGCCSQNRSKFWNIKRPGADLSSFYGSEETLRLALRKNLMDYRLVYGKVPMLPLAGDESLPGNLLANTARQDNYGDMFWPIGQYIGTPYNLEGVAPTAPTYNRNGNDGQSRWFFAKMRFSLSKTTSVKLRVVADDWCTIRVSSGGSIVHTVPSMGGNVPNEFTWSLAAGDWAITFLVEEKESLNSPSHVGYEVYLDNVLTYKPSITETRVLTLMGGTSRDVPSRGESVPHAVRLPFERPAGTALSVYANRRAGNIRKQIVEATGYEQPVFFNDSEANLGGVRVDSVQVGNVIKDSIYIYTPLRSDGTPDIEYQLRITKL